MSLIKKLSQLKKLEALKADKRWEQTTKYDLLAEIASQNRMMQAQKLNTTEQADLFAMRVVSKIAPSFAKVVAAFLIVFLGSGLSLAAQASVPGEALWPIKRSIEKAELTLTFSPVKETEIHIKHVGKRLDEIDKIMGEENGTPENQVKKEKAIAQAATHLTKDMVAVDSSLKVAKQEKKPVEVVELAKKVTDATKEVSASLKEKSVASGGDKNIEKALDGAKAANEEVKNSAVALALEVHEELMAQSQKSNDENNSDNNNEIAFLGENETSTAAIIEEVVQEKEPEVADEDLETVKNLVKEMIASEIDETSVEVEGVKQKAEQVNNNEDVEAIKKENKDIDEAKNELDTIKEDPAIEETLEEAKSLLEDGFLKNAYEKIASIKEKYQRAEVILDEIEEAILNHDTLSSEVIDEAQDQPTEIDNTQTEEEELPATNTEVYKPEEAVN